jgi:CheY-like chemotaxis protein
MRTVLMSDCPVSQAAGNIPAWAGTGNGKGGTRSSSARRSKRHATARKAHGTRVLLFGRLRELALYRAEVLRTAGFTVLIPDTKEEAVAAIRRASFDVAILTYTLSSDTVQELAELIREYSPEAPLIAISNSSKEDREIDPDEIVIADEGPAALIAALRRATRPN